MLKRPHPEPSTDNDPRKKVVPAAKEPVHLPDAMILKIFRFSRCKDGPLSQKPLAKKWMKMYLSHLYNSIDVHNCAGSLAARLKARPDLAKLVRFIEITFDGYIGEGHTTLLANLPAINTITIIWNGSLSSDNYLFTKNLDIDYSTLKALTTNYEGTEKRSVFHEPFYLEEQSGILGRLKNLTRLTIKFARTFDSDEDESDSDDEFYGCYYRERRARTPPSTKELAKNILPNLLYLSLQFEDQTIPNLIPFFTQLHLKKLQILFITGATKPTNHFEFIDLGYDRQYSCVNPLNAQIERCTSLRYLKIEKPVLTRNIQFLLKVETVEFGLGANVEFVSLKKLVGARKPEDELEFLLLTESIPGKEGSKGKIGLDSHSYLDEEDEDLETIDQIRKEMIRSGWVETIWGKSGNAEETRDLRRLSKSKGIILWGWVDSMRANDKFENFLEKNWVILAKESGEYDSGVEEIM